MIAFDKTALENTFLLREIARLKDKGFVSQEQFDSASAGLAVLKGQKNFLVRFGFFLLGNFLVSSIIGVLSLVIGSFAGENFELVFFLYAVIAFILAEVFASQKQYRFGLDDSFVLYAQGALIGGIGATTESPLLAFAAAAVVGFVCCLRYVNTLSALISCVGIAGFVADLIIEHKLIDLSFLPFVMLLLAVAIYFAVNKISNSPKVFYYKNALQFAYAFSLVLGYFSVNYLVVRELSVQLMKIVVTDNSDIPFAFLFYGFTFAIPVFYIIYSLLIKDKTMLNIGFLTLAFSFFTIRYYYQIMPIENALILGGTLLFGLAYFFMQRLKGKASGITFEPDRGADTDVLLNAQAIIINSQLDLKTQEPVTSDMPFGEGEFSGGGAGNEF